MNFNPEFVSMIGVNDHLLIIIVLALLLFGGKRIPELTRNLGRGIGEFQKGLEEGRYEYHKAAQKTKEQEVATLPEDNTQKNI